MEVLSAVLLSALSVLTTATFMPSFTSAPAPPASTLGYQVFLPVVYKAFFFSVVATVTWRSLDQMCL